MKGNNSLTCTKTVQKQPFLMSDTSCPQNAFYVSHSLIKQHPGEQDGGHVNFVCAWGYARVCMCVREGERDWCVCVKEIFGFWIVRCDLGTLIFTQQASITLVVVLFTVFLLWQSTRFPSEQRGGLFFFFSGFLFCQTLNIKRVKSKKRNSLQWGVLPTKEWGGVRIQYDSRCALLNLILLYIFFPRLKCHLQLRVSASIFCSLFFCQTVVVELCTVTHSITNTKEHHCKFAYQRVLSTPVWWLC